MLIIIFAILLLAMLLYYPVKDLYLIYIKGFPSGPISLPLIGGLYLLSPTQPHLSVDKLYKKYGPIFTLRVGPFGPAVFIKDLKIADEVFSKTDASDRPKVPFFDVINNGADGIGSCRCGTDKFKYLVKVLHKGQMKFSNANLIRQIHPYLSLLMERFDYNTGTVYDPREDVLKACSAIFSSIVYGIKTDSLDSDDLNSRMVYHNTIMSCVSPTHLFNIIPVLWKLPSPLKNKIQKCIQHREGLMEDQLKHHIAEFDNELKDMMDIVADSVLNYSPMMERKGTKTHDLFMSIWMYYLAGCDTLVDTMLWLLIYMCLYPGVQTQIQHEIDSVTVRADENILDHKSAMPYMRATILESLRMSSPPALGVPRSCNNDITLGGHYIPKDTMIMVTQWTIHHDGTNWPDPFMLKPERFLDQDGNLLPLNHIFKKMPFIPFSRGVRSCLGQYMALDILFMFLSDTLQSYHVTLADNCFPDLNGKVLMNLRPDQFSVVFQKRQTKNKF